VTIAFEVKDALVERTRAAPQFARLNQDDAIWDSVYTDRLPKELIWFSDIKWVLGNEIVRVVPYEGYPDGEAFDISVFIESHWPADNQAQANARVKEMYLSLKDLFSQSKSLGIQGVSMVKVVPLKFEEGMDANSGRGAIMSAVVRIVMLFD